MSLFQSGVMSDCGTSDSKRGARVVAAPGREGRNVDHFAIAIAPFDEPAIRAHLAHHAVAIEQAGPRYGAKGEGPSIYIADPRSEEHTSELQSLMRISYAVFCLKKKTKKKSRIDQHKQLTYNNT